MTIDLKSVMTHLEAIRFNVWLIQPVIDLKLQSSILADIKYSYRELGRELFEDTIKTTPTAQ